jgi:hypothetical protein
MKNNLTLKELKELAPKYDYNKNTTFVIGVDSDPHGKGEPQILTAVIDSKGYLDTNKTLNQLTSLKNYYANVYWETYTGKFAYYGTIEELAKGMNEWAKSTDSQNQCYFCKQKNKN